MNKVGKVLFFARPENEDDEIYCPFCGAAYDADAKFKCGLGIIGQTPVIEKTKYGSKETGFDCTINFRCPVKVKNMQPSQLKATVNYLLDMESVCPL